MNGAIRKISFIAAVLLVFQAGLLFSLFNTGRQNPSLVLRTFYESADFYDQAFASGAGEVPAASGRVYAGIIPHHLVVADKIAAFFLGLKNEKVRKVILLSPDHFGLTGSRIIISGVSWKTPYGILPADNHLAARLSADTGFLYLNDARIQREHGINYETPFIKKIFPGAEIVAIIVKPNARQSDLDKLAKAIAQNTDSEKDLVLASIDFSHDAPAAVADVRDKISQGVINDLDYDDYQKISADCPAALYVLMKYAVSAKAWRPRLIWNTNSGKIIGRPDEPSVSHNFYYFFH
ncbi:MAG: AmmeMemoRadiSam system protein B [Patescibacteria group bacterium]|nr:AmmeMemoRadiSam system protein B [Patescibacteria group bacterium]